MSILKVDLILGQAKFTLSIHCHDAEQTTPKHNKKCGKTNTMKSTSKLYNAVHWDGIFQSVKTCLYDPDDLQEVTGPNLQL